MYKSVSPPEMLMECIVLCQSKYKEGRKSLSQSFYSQLPETAETQFAKSVAELQSEVSSEPFVLTLLIEKLWIKNAPHHQAGVFLSSDAVQRGG